MFLKVSHLGTKKNVLNLLSNVGPSLDILLCYLLARNELKIRANTCLRLCYMDVYPVKIPV